jgi:hypothetical protein
MLIFGVLKIVVRNQTILNLQTVSLKIVSEDENNNIVLLALIDLVGLSLK